MSVILWVIIGVALTACIGENSKADRSTTALLLPITMTRMNHAPLAVPVFGKTAGSSQVQSKVRGDEGRQYGIR